MARTRLLILPLFLTLCADTLAGEARPQRLLWEVPVTRFAGQPRELVPAGDKLMVFAGGVLYALEADTGKECWHYPRNGIAFDPGVVPVYILKVMGDQVIVRLPRREGEWAQGCEALSLADGSPKRSLCAKGFKQSSATTYYLPGTELVLWNYEGKEQTEVRVLDLQKWCETARFTMPKASGDLTALDGKVYGTLKRPNERFMRCFTVDVKEGVLFSLPMREEHHFPLWTLDPDGTRHHREGSFDAKCTYLGVHYQRDLFADDCVPAQPRMPGLFYDRRAQSEKLTVQASGSHLYVAEAAAGALRAVIRVLDDPGPKQDPELNRSALAVDDERVYFGWSGGLRAYGTWPVNPEHPDPNDPADPACALARARAALTVGDLDGALDAFQDIGAMLRLRPSQRDEVAALLSQLSRLPAARHAPARWGELVANEGWLAGELFLSEYARPEVTPRYPNVAALLRIGTPEALKAAAAFLDAPPEKGYHYADFAICASVEAATRLGDKAPWEKVLSKSPLAVRALLMRPIDEPTFQALLPKLKEARAKKGFQDNIFRYAWYLAPEQLLRWVGEDVDAKDENLQRIVAAAKAQVALRKRGEGDREPIEIRKPGAMTEGF